MWSILFIIYDVGCVFYLFFPFFYLMLAFIIYKILPSYMPVKLSVHTQFRIFQVFWYDITLLSKTTKE